jgi:hypothetical protein
MNYAKDTAPAAGSEGNYTYQYGPTQPVNINLTSEEMTSFLNYNRPPYYAIKNVQVRVNADDTIEMSGTINTNYLLDTVVGGVYSRSQVTSAFPPTAIFPGNLNMYYKASGQIESQKAVELSLKSVEIQGIGVPSPVYSSSDATNIATNILNSFISRIEIKNHATYDFVKVKNSMVNFIGTVPSFLNRIPSD